MRTALISYICRQDTPTFGVDEGGDPLPKPPFVLLVLGGGSNTYELILKNLQASRPVICLPDSGGAAFNVYHYVTTGGQSFDGLELDPDDARTCEAAKRLLPLIKHFGEVQVGANKEKQVRRQESNPHPLALCVTCALPLQPA